LSALADPSRVTPCQDASPIDASSPKEPAVPYATPDDVIRALRALTVADYLRMWRCAYYHLRGCNPYHDPDDLRSAAIDSVCNAAQTIAAGEKQHGRAWRTDVPFMAHVLQTIRGLASDSRRAAEHRVMVRDGQDHEARDPDDPQALLLRAERDQQAQATLEHLKKDAELREILEGLAEGKTHVEIQKTSSMTKTTYESARRRLLRRLETMREQGGHS
jgi:hypothetical protein